MIDVTHLVNPSQPVDVNNADQTHNRILECALACKADVIVSGGTHLLDLVAFEGIPILKVRELIRRYFPTA